MEPIKKGQIAVVVPHLGEPQVYISAADGELRDDVSFAAAYDSLPAALAEWGRFVESGTRLGKCGPVAVLCRLEVLAEED